MNLGSKRKKPKPEPGTDPSTTGAALNALLFAANNAEDESGSSPKEQAAIVPVPDATQVSPVWSPYTKRPEFEKPTIARNLAG